MRTITTSLITEFAIELTIGYTGAPLSLLRVDTPPLLLFPMLRLSPGKLLLERWNSERARLLALPARCLAGLESPFGSTLYLLCFKLVLLVLLE